MSAAPTVLRVRARIGTDRAHDLTAEIASGVTLEERELTSTAPTSDFALYQALPLMLTFEDR